MKTREIDILKIAKDSSASAVDEITSKISREPDIERAKIGLAWLNGHLSLSEMGEYAIQWGYTRKSSASKHYTSSLAGSAISNATRHLRACIKAGFITLTAE